MNKASLLYLILFGAIALIGAYEALFPLPASTTFTRFFALSAYLLLCVSLIIGPLVVLRPKEFGQLMEPRRAVGIACFIFVLLHVLLVISIRFGGNFGVIFSGANMWIATLAAAILLALTITSSDYAIRKLGPAAWKNIQRLNYLAFALSSLHFISYATGLFVNVNGNTFVNAAEVSLLLLGAVAVILQAAGFVARRKNKGNETKASADSAKAEN